VTVRCRRHMHCSLLPNGVTVGDLASRTFIRREIHITYALDGLDEANRIGDLSNILKTIATGGADTRRRLYTTSTMETKPYQARLWMTMNTGDPREETVASRMLIFDAAKPEGKAPYRATHHLEWSAEKRNALWTELVGRLAIAMQTLKIAEKRGKADAKVTHRMSDFFVFLTALAEGEASPNDAPGYALPELVRVAMEATESADRRIGCARNCRCAGAGTLLPEWKEDERQRMGGRVGAIRRGARWGSALAAQKELGRMAVQGERAATGRTVRDDEAD